MSTELREVVGSSTDSEESRHNPLTMSTMSTRNNSLTASMFAHHIMTRSLPTIDGSFQSQTTLREYTKTFPLRLWLMEAVSRVVTEPEHSINIPSYIMRGAGKQTHVEYEIRIFLVDDRWLLLRRFSRFRELHLCMKTIYGDKVKSVMSLTLTSFISLFPLRSQKSRFQSANCLHQTAKALLKRDVANWKRIFAACSSYAREYRHVRSTMAMAAKDSLKSPSSNFRASLRKDYSKVESTERVRVDNRLGKDERRRKIIMAKLLSRTF